MATLQGARQTKWDTPSESTTSLEAAAQAAAKVNAMLIAKGKLKPSQLSHSSNIKAKGRDQIIAEVEINDVPIGCRNMLTRGSTQEEVSKMSGSAVSTRGRYMSFEDREKNNMGERPLYLCIQAPRQESVELAVTRIKEIIANGYKKTSKFAPPPPPTSSALTGFFPPHMGMAPPVRMTNVPPPAPLMSLSPQHTVLTYQDKMYIGLEHAPPSFDVKSKLMGPGGSFLGHIQMESGSTITLRGKGSGFLDPLSGREAFEAMHLLIQHSHPLGLQQGKQLAENLVHTVQNEYAQFQQALASMPPAVNPGTAALLAGLVQHQQPPQAQNQLPPPGLIQTGGVAGLVAVSQHHLSGLSSIPSLMSTPVLPTQTLASNLVPHSASGGVMLSPAQANIHMTTSQTQPMPGPLTSQTIYMQAQQGLGQPAPPPPAQFTIPPPTGQFNSVQQSGLVQAPVSLHQPFQFTQPPPTMTLNQVTVQGPTLGRLSPGLTQASSTAPLYSVPSNSVYSPGAPVYYSQYNLTGAGKDEGQNHKRRFTEEKQVDKLPDNLLGYQHGPPHLMNMPASNRAPSPSMQHGHVTGPGMAPPPPPPDESNRSAERGDGLMMAPPPPPSMGGLQNVASIVGGLQNVASIDTRLMPPPPPPPTGAEPGRKRLKATGALGNVSAYGSDEETESSEQQDVNSSSRQYSQYSSQPQVYSQPPPGHYVSTSLGHQYYTTGPPPPHGAMQVPHPAHVQTQHVANTQTQEQQYYNSSSSGDGQVQYGQQVSTSYGTVPPHFINSETQPPVHLQIQQQGLTGLNQYADAGQTQTPISSVSQMGAAYWVP